MARRSSAITRCRPWRSSTPPFLAGLAAADRVGVRVLLVHALHERAADFYTALGFRPSPTDALHLHLLLADARGSLSG